MKRQNIIILVTPTLEPWGNFKKLCEAKGLPYHSLKTKEFPIEWTDKKTGQTWKIERKPFN